MAPHDVRPFTITLPRTYVLAAYAHTVPRTLALVVSGIALSTTIDSGPGPWAWVLIGPLLLAQLLVPPWTRASFHISGDAAGATVRTGLLVVRSRTVEWHSVSAVTVTAPWAYRFFKLSRVQLSQGGQGETQLDIPAADPTATALIQKAWENVEHVRAISAETDDPGTVALYTARLQDTLLAGVLQGRLLILGSAAALSIGDFLNSTGFSPSLLAVLARHPALAALAVLLVIGASGICGTGLRFHRFRVDRSKLGTTIRYGLVETQERVIVPSAVVGAVCTSNILETLTGRARLSLLTKDSATSTGSNTILPSLPRTTVADVLTEILSVEAHPHVERWRRTRKTVAGTLLTSTVLVLVVPALLAVILVVAAGWPAYAGVLVASSTAIAAYGLGRVVAGRATVSADGRLVFLRSRFVTERQSFVWSAEIHAISSLSLGPTAVMTRLHVYSGRSRRLWATLSPHRELRRIAFGPSNASQARTRTRSGRYRA